MRKTIGRLAIALMCFGLVAGITPPLEDAAPMPTMAESALESIGPDPAAAAWKCASWGCGERVAYNGSAGSGEFKVDDKYVTAAWWVDQSRVNACTALWVHRSTGGWYWVGQDCGGGINGFRFDYGFSINAVQIRSKDDRGRYRYLTLAGTSMSMWTP